MVNNCIAVFMFVILFDAEANLLCPVRFYVLFQFMVAVLSEQLFSCAAAVEGLSSDASNVVDVFYSFGTFSWRGLFHTPLRSDGFRLQVVGCDFVLVKFQERNPLYLDEPSPSAGAALAASFAAELEQIQGRVSVCVIPAQSN